MKRIAPHDLDSERALLKTVLEDFSPEGVVFPQVADLPADAFYEGRHRAVWQACSEVAKSGRRPDYESVRAVLAQSGELERFGGVKWFFGLGDGVPRVPDAAALAVVLREKRALRRLLGQLAKLQDAIFDGQDLAELREALARLLIESATELERPGTLDTEALTREALRDLEAEILGQTVGIPTGLPDLDERLRGGGLLRGQLVYIGARPSRGKTALLTQIAEHTGKLGKRALFFSLEMPAREVQKRRLLAAAGVNIERARRGDAPTKDRALADLARAVADVVAAPIRLTDNGTRTVARIRAEAFRERAARGLDLVVLDYLGYVETGARDATLYERTTEVSRALHALAGDLDVPVVVGVQLNRAPEGQGKAGARRPTLAHFRDSGAVEQDADIALLIHQADVENAIQEGAAELILAKQRNGWTGVVPVYFDAGRVRFASRARDDEPAEPWYARA